MSKLSEYHARMCRSIFDNILLIHPAHNQDNRRILAEAFDLEEEELDALHALAMWICDHDLERALGLEGEDPRTMLRQVALDGAYKRIQEIAQASGPGSIRDSLYTVLPLLGAAGANS